MMKLWGAILLLVVITPTSRAFTSVDELRDSWNRDLEFFGDAISSCDRNVVLSQEYLELGADCANEDWDFWEDCPESCRKADELATVECIAESFAAWTRFLDEMQESLARYGKYPSDKAEAYFLELLDSSDYWQIDDFILEDGSPNYLSVAFFRDSAEKLKSACDIPEPSTFNTATKTDSNAAFHIASAINWKIVLFLGLVAFIQSLAM